MNGICKECEAEVPIDATSAVGEDGGGPWECPQCGHPNAMGDFWAISHVGWRPTPDPVPAKERP